MSAFFIKEQILAFDNDRFGSLLTSIDIWLRDTAYATKELVNQVHLFNNYLKAYTEDIEIKTLLFNF